MKKRNLFFLSCFLLLVPALSAQHLGHSVISSGGNINNASGIMLEWTLGELSTESYTVSGWTLEQGFQHGNLRIKGLDIQNEIFPGLTIYPNPSPDRVCIDFGTETKHTVQLKIIDLKGILLKQNMIQKGMIRVEMDLNSLSPGIYFLQVRQKDKPYYTTHQIIKTIE